jgi:hypothetical protein
VLSHPDDFVRPDNIRELQIGHIITAGRGEGENSDCVVGDLMFTDQHAIDLIRRGTHRSLSVGYGASYVPNGRGRARQTDIVVNHLALLENGGARCGDRCVIQDAKVRRPAVTSSKFERQLAILRRRMRDETMPLPPGIRPPPTKIERRTGIPLSEQQRRQIVAADAKRCRDGLRAINEANRKRWDIR